MSSEMKGRTAGSVIASIILSLLLLIPMTLGIVLWEMRSTVSEKGVRYFLDEVEWDRIDLSELSSGQADSLFNDLTDSLNQMTGDDRFTAADVQELITAPGMKSFLSREIGDFAEDLKTGQSNASVTKEELQQLVLDNWSIFEPLFTEEAEENLREFIKDAAAGQPDPEAVSALLAYADKYGSDEKYTEMLENLRETGTIRPEDSELLYSFFKNEYFVTMFQENASAFIPEEMTRELSTTYMRSQIPPEESRIINAALSPLPFIILLAFCAVLWLIYFVANRRIIGDAFIGLGALVMTILLPLTLTGYGFTSLRERWLSAYDGNYLRNFISGAFSGYHLKTNLILTAAGLVMIILGIILNVNQRKKRTETELTV